MEKRTRGRLSGCCACVSVVSFRRHTTAYKVKCAKRKNRQNLREKPVDSVTGTVTFSAARKWHYAKRI